ncbi:amidohydrolase family protein [Paracoccus sp. S-4012]|uniref:IS66 family insertion sequence element accessory protein TnpB n=1 Tax=Paracoccus sp. S-4012 TaxID=2665648 RepID=UPI0012B11A47|nr:IS66 family insertion sequence element accessory protein TnpB [Paracoccus sp. S-4012]MRX50426.1 amidohydrolase family protein [Paracoccus sp. S-4012]
MRADRIKILIWDKTGLVLIHRRLEGGKFVWPQVRNRGRRRCWLPLRRAAVAARIMGVEDRRGAIEPGKLADLVVLNQNPLQVPGDAIRDTKA